MRRDHEGHSFMPALDVEVVAAVADDTNEAGPQCPVAARSVRMIVALLRFLRWNGSLPGNAAVLQNATMFGFAWKM